MARPRLASCIYRLIGLLATMGLFLFTVHRCTAAENEQGAQLAAMCAACHRLDGRDHGIPSIIGLEPKKLTETMEAFRTDKRSSQIMNVVARSLTTEEIATLAEDLAMQRRGPEQP